MSQHVSTPTDLPQLPTPQILWSGTCARHGVTEGVPIRVVRMWVMQSPDGRAAYRPVPAIVVEESTGKDAMGSPLWKPTAQYNLPREFWSTVFPE